MIEICVVIVLYKCKLIESSSYKSLINIPRNNNFKFHLIIFDNSPDPLIFDLPSGFFEYVDYYISNENVGVVPAYNYALKYCKSKRIKWLLRLDQDSEYDMSLFYSFKRAISINSSCASYVPKITSKQRIISPSYRNLSGIYTPIEDRLEGVINKKITFINSLSFCNVFVPLLKNGFPERFPLDMSDHDFAYLHSTDDVFILDAFVEHDLSIAGNNYVSLKRYQNIVGNEMRFAKLHYGKFEFVIFLFKLAIRSFKFFITGNFSYFYCTIGTLLR